MPGRAAQPLRTLAFWILLLLLPCLAGCGPAPARPGPEPPASGQTQSPHKETRPTEPTQPTEPIPASLLAATVTGVIDGDTAYMRLENGRTEKVRFIGVDTPEIHHPTMGEEPYGREAAAFTARSLSARKVWLELDAQERDQYGRLLAYVWLAPPRDTSEAEVRAKMFNARLLTEGYAQVLTVPPNVKYADLFVKLQREARDAGKGLWGLPAAAAQGSSEPYYIGNLHSKKFHRPDCEWAAKMSPPTGSTSRRRRRTSGRGTRCAGCAGRRVNPNSHNRSSMARGPRRVLRHPAKRKRDFCFYDVGRIAGRLWRIMVILHWFNKSVFRKTGSRCT